MARIERLWVTTSKLAGLPGMPGTERGVRKRAKSENWPGRKRQAIGGGWEYPLECLPLETQQALLAAEAAPRIKFGAGSEAASPALSPEPQEIEASGYSSQSLDSQASGDALAASSPLRQEYSSAETTLPGGVMSTLPAPPEYRFGAELGTALQLREEIQAQVIARNREAGLKNSLSASEKGQRRIDAKVALLTAVERFARSKGCAITNAQYHVSSCYNLGELGPELGTPDWVREVIPEVSAASLERWRLTVKTQGLDALAGSYGKRKGKINTQKEMRDLVIGLLVEYPHARVPFIRQALSARNGHRASLELPPWDLPSDSAIAKWVAAWKENNKQVFTALRNPDEWKNKFMVAFGSQSEGIERLNQRWEMDSTPADLLLQEGRYTLLGVIDVYSRRSRLLVAKTSKAVAIATLLRHTLLDWGVPEEVKTDNGSDYVSEHLRRVFGVGGLNVVHTLCPPFQPWHKPHIEAFFHTFSHDLVEYLPGYIGHSVAERKELEARQSFAERLFKKNERVELRLSAAELQQFCDRWCRDIYERRPHEGLEGKSPFEVLSAWREPVRRVGDARVLDILLSEAPRDGGRRVVRKDGIELDNRLYLAPELYGWVKKSVAVRFDPTDLGRIYVFHAETLEFLSIAECPEVTGISREEVAKKAHELQKKYVQEARAELKGVAKKVRASEVVEEILSEREAAAEKLVMLPHRSVPHESAGIQEAAQAVSARETLDASRIGKPPVYSEEEQREMARAAEKMQAKAAARAAIEEPWVKYERLIQVAERTEEEEAFVRRFELTPEGKALKKCREIDRQNRSRRAANA